MNLEKAGKKLSFLLRHCREPRYVDLDGGWAPVEVILQTLNLDRATLDAVVAADSKTRFSYDETGSRIRANQGHSIPGVRVEMEQPEPPEFLYHGTATRFLEAIMQEGLKPMGRQWVHISPDYDTAVNVGSRHGEVVVLTVRARELVAAGYPLYRSANGVWQVKAVPPEFLQL